MQPDASTQRVQGFISAVGRRRWFLHLAGAVAVAAIVNVVLALTGASTIVVRVTTVLVGALVLGLTQRYRTRRAAAAATERAVPACRNLIITAEELERHPARASAGITARVHAAANAALGSARPGDVVPLYRIVGLAAVGVAAILLSAPAGRQVVQQTAAAVADALPSLGAARLSVRIDPPAYSGREAQTLTSPSRIEALEGSRITFTVGKGLRVRFGSDAVGAPMVARESGYFAVEGEAATKGANTLLIPLTVVRDRVPTVRIDAPGKDLLLATGGRTIPVTIEATDDLGLEMLELRYTKVSGTGEQFEFQEGTLPVRLQRTSSRQWRASGELALGKLNLGPGDSLVYRAVARDARSGSAGTAASDTYFVEVAGPGQVALDGIDMPPELERYAMSQQMIVLKLERLRPKVPQMARQALVEEAAGIAAEQRTVRANFIFLLGGHVEDEEEEAEQSHEIQEGRLENTARKDINAAISLMTRVEQGLTALNVDAALPPARAAVEALQRAFGKSRYLLRSLAVRSRLDPSRRLTGNIADAGDWQRSRPEGEERDGEAARQLLERLVDTAARMRSGQAPPAPTLQVLAESALAIDSSFPVWQEVATGILQAGDAAALEDVIRKIAPEAARGALPRTGLADTASRVRRAHAAERQR